MNLTNMLPLLVVLLISFTITGNDYVFATSDVTESEFSQMVEKINANFSKILLDDLKPGENFVFSPINVYVALALVHFGATGTTKTELSNILGHFFAGDGIFESHFKLGQLLYKIQHPPSDSAEVHVANGVFTEYELFATDQYSRKVGICYDISVLLLPFVRGGSEPTKAVNQWISQKTFRRIPKLFENEISNDTKILLASALYFAGKWSNSFSASNTETKTFNTGAGQIQVPMMRINESVPYVDSTNLKFQAISIPYSNGDYSMLIVLPYRDQSLQSLINAFESEQTSEIIASLKSTYVNYEIPRMKFRRLRDINQHLVKMGAKKMFDEAELDIMVKSKNVSVSKITHFAEIEVNEQGTKASAVKAVQIAPVSETVRIDPPISFHADRPFLFSIYHRNTTVLLFTGAVQNPTVENV